MESTLTNAVQSIRFLRLYLLFVPLRFTRSRDPYRGQFSRVTIAVARSIHGVASFLNPGLPICHAI